MQGNLFPTEEQQKASIRQKTGRQKAPAFPFSEKDIERVLLMGSGFVNGKQRIALLYEREPSPRIRADYLRKEYGTSGRPHSFLNGTAGVVEHDARGIRFRRWGEPSKALLRWPDVEKRIHALIRNGQYLNNEEKEEFLQLKSQYEVQCPGPSRQYPRRGAAVPCQEKQIPERESGESGRRSILHDLREKGVCPDKQEKQKDHPADRSLVSPDARKNKTHEVAL